MLDVTTCTVLMLVGIELKGVIPVSDGDGVTDGAVKTIVDDKKLLGPKGCSPLPTSLDINKRDEMVLVRGAVFEGAGVDTLSSVVELI